MTPARGQGSIRGCAPTARLTHRRSAARILPAATTRINFTIFIGSDVNRRLRMRLRAAPPHEEDSGENQEQAENRSDQGFAAVFHRLGGVALEVG
jgi:hypothetical protein